jgi:lipopolysaccharide transport system ATP-binding protein
MIDSIITVENLSKVYRLGAHRESTGSTTIRDSLWNSGVRLRESIYNALRPSKKTEGHKRSEFWALQNLNFSVKEGEVVGIVGRNGAGKSTLLKVLSRITEPTIGRIVLRGRVASLLEVGTGFHPELSGRENIYLNGSILGMSRQEIRCKFDEIVQFAEVERFLDTPVKRYSSGMYVRLAFSVAAHLEPEILVVDEVLAVGDAQFQKKCLGKMKEVSISSGRTVLFVSHNMSAVRALCTRAIHLRDGQIVEDGGTTEVVHNYLHVNETISSKGEISESLRREFGTGKVRFTRIRLLDGDGIFNVALEAGQPFTIEVCFEVSTSANPFFLTIGFQDENGQHLMQTRLPASNAVGWQLEPGQYSITFESHAKLQPGTFYLFLGASEMDGLTYDWLEQAIEFQSVNPAADSPNHYPVAWTVRGFAQIPGNWTELVKQ